MSRRSSGILLLGIPALIFVVLLWSSKWAVLRRDAATDTVSHPQQITSTAGVDPAFSPDGSSTVYASDRSGHFEIYRRQLVDGASEIQLTNDGMQNVEPSWSPDGQFIAYTSEGQQGIFVIPAAGGPAKRLTTSGSEPAWSPDGQGIAFKSTAHGNATIWLIAAAGGTAQPLTHVHNPEGSHSSPNWHPDGMSVLFSAPNAGGPDVWSVRVRDGAISAITISNDKSAHAFPTYAPSGRSIFYLVSGANEFVVNEWPLSGGKPRELVKVASPPPHDISFDRSGHRIIYSSGNVFLADLAR